jgi:hypothetical protein
MAPLIGVGDRNRRPAGSAAAIHRLLRHARILAGHAARHG